MDPNEGFGQSYSLPSAITPHPDFGRLRLRCDPPDAVVVVNGVTQGRASDLVAPSFLQLEPGPHMVEIRKEGYSTFRAEIVISPEVIKTLAVTLRRLPGLAEEADLGSGR